ncbi:uncharacterized protein TNCV_3928761 [Trichonephila clavipes]|nr:uncharacterized protein TNCV_3928761 [Trichonephila clavipes]
MQYFYLKGLSPSNIKAELDSTLGESTLLSTVKYGVAKFKRDRTNCQNEHRIGLLNEVTTGEMDAKLLKVVQEVAEESKIKAATEIVEKKQNLSSDIVKCGISVDGTWQRRCYTSMNGCVAAISVDTGSSSKMEIVGASRIFLRSEKNRRLHYTQYYGDGNSKAFMSGKDTYGLNSVTKFLSALTMYKRDLSTEMSLAVKILFAFTLTAAVSGIRPPNDDVPCTSMSSDSPQ